MSLDGLMKQSFSITTSNNQHLHLISYYSRLNTPNLMQPTTDPQLRHIRPPKNMYPESSVNEAQNVPAVTRAPMAGGSPFPAVSRHSLPTPQSPMPLLTLCLQQATPQMGSQSPYARAGHSPQVPIMMPHYGPPTPPYHPYSIMPAHHMGYPQGTVLIHSPYPPQWPTHMDRMPPHMNHPHAAPPPQGHMYPHHHYAAQLAAYARAQQQAPELAQQQAHLANQQAAHHQVPKPTTASLPEQGPVLPALNALRQKSATPQPTEPRPSESLNPPEVNGHTIRASSPGRTTIPALASLLNHNGPDANVEAPAPGSRSGSRSPSNSQRQAAQMVLQSHTAADTNAISKLNSKFL